MSCAIIAAQGMMLPVNDEFKVVIYEGDDVGEQIKTLGHEIGHTFHFNLGARILRSIFPIERSSTFWQNHIEPFCNAFAEKWLEINGREAVQRWWEEFLRRLTDDAVEE